VLIAAIIARHVLKYTGAEIYGVCRTGQLSQVIYLHNLQFKQGVPPNTIHDWRDDSPAGPISAFLQLITDLEIWLPDADDPLGILGDIMQIRRPLDRNRETNEPVDSGEVENTAPDLAQKVRITSHLRFSKVCRENVSEKSGVSLVAF